MNNIAEMIQAIFIGILVANFLLNTCRVINAIEICKECLVTLNNTAFENKNLLTKKFYKDIYRTMSKAYVLTKNYTGAIKYAKKCLAMHHELGERLEESELSIEMATWCYRQNKSVEAKELYHRALIIMKEIGDRNGEAICYFLLGSVLSSLGENVKAEEYLEKAVPIMREIGDRNGEAKCYVNLGTVFKSLAEYVKAQEYCEKALAIMREIGNRNGEASCYVSLGNVFHSLSEYVKAQEYFEKALSIMREIGDRNGEAMCYVNLGTVFESLAEYVKAKEYCETALPMMREIGNRNGEASCYVNLGNVFHSLSEYVKAQEYFEKALRYMREIGNRNEEASCYANLGIVFQSLSEYVKAKEYFEKALPIMREIGDRKGEASCYGNLGNVFKTLGEYVKAQEYFENALSIRREIGDRNGEALCYVDLGNVFYSLGEYVKAKDYVEKALPIMKAIGNRKGEAKCYGNVGNVFYCLGEHVKAKEYIEKALKLTRKIGDRNGEASYYALLGRLFISFGKYSMANTYLKKALDIQKQTGDRKRKADCYVHFGLLFQSIGDYVKGEEYYKKSMVINKEIGYKRGEANANIHLGSLFSSLDEYVKAEEYLRKGLALSAECGEASEQFSSLCQLAFVKYNEGKAREAISYLLSALQKAEHLRGFLGDNDQLKISFIDKYVFPYWLLSYLFCVSGNFKEGLHVSELGRARALADLMSAQYTVENQLSADPQTWVSIEKIMKKESNCTCLYISYSSCRVLLWILKPSGVMHFRLVDVSNVQEGLAVRNFSNLDEFFAKGSFRSFGILPGEHCEDRFLNDVQMKDQSSEENSHEPLRKNDQEILGPKRDLSLCHKLIIAPVADLLDEPEVIVVPDRSLCSVPFAALPDGSGKFFAEKFRIRFVPSLSTLKIIQDSPADYHSQAGALIVGNPDVGKVCLKGRCQEISRLPTAESEAIMVGEMLGVKPLLGKEATKQAVLREIHSVSLIHFAAHGDAESGEVLLAPSCAPKGILQEEDFLLTVSEISQVQLRAKLVVLSCSHSARGKIKAEGVVGIARAFLGSGARSVLVALWALDDEATEQLMRRFYEHLVRGERASESLHQAMKWMRGNGYPDVTHWAPFVLIGDNVVFDFEKKCK